MQRERSAGFILYLEPGPKQPSRRYLLLDYGRHWDYAKGHVEKGEDDLAAAVRELAEETGIDDAEPITGFAHELEYFFRHPKRGLIKKTVIFFVARARDEEVQLSDEHVGHAWLPYDQALKRLTYKNARAALEAAEAFLAKAPTGRKRSKKKKEA
jgi:8-oxo-dGTP pyrophosphatase MutT (NUDIX family)